MLNRNKSSNLSNLSWLALTTIIVFAALTMQARAQDAVIDVTSVSFLQNGSVVDTQNGEQLSGVIDLEVQVNFITNQADFGTGRLDAWLSVSTPTMASTSFTLLKPSALLTIPTSVDSSTGNSYTATIPSDLLATDLTWLLSWVDYSTNSNPSASHLIKAPVFTPTIFSTPPKKEDDLTLSSAGAITVGNLMDGSPGTGDAVLSDSCPVGEVVTSMAVRFDPGLYGGTIKQFHFTCAPFLRDGTAGPQDGTTVYVTSPYAYLPFDAQYQTVSCPSGLLTGLRGMTDTTNVYTMGHFCSRSHQILDGSADLSMGTPIGDPSVINSGTPSEINCPAGHVMTGVDTHTNANDEITGVYMQCTDVLVNGEIFIGDTSDTVLDYFADGPSPSAVEHHFSCPQNSVLSQLDASFDPQVVDSLGFACSLLNADGSTGISISQSDLGYVSEYGTVRGSTQSLPCSGRMITGIRGRAGQRVDQIGHHCSDFEQMLAGSSEAGIGDPFGSTTGGSPVDQRCGAGKVATGAYVWVNSNYGDIDDIKLICTDSAAMDLEPNDIVLDYFADGPSPSAVEHHFSCPQNSVLSQLDASFDPQVVDSLGFACSLLNADGSTGISISQSDLGYASEYGTVRGTTQSLPCDGRMITGIRGRAGQRVDQIGHHCSDLGQMLTGAAETGLGDPFGSTTGGSPVDQRCGAGKVATGAYVWVNSNYGDIGDIRLICADFNVVMGQLPPIDNLPPVLTIQHSLLAEPTTGLVKLTLEAALDSDFNELTVTCNDAVDGDRPVTITDEVDTAFVDIYRPIYRCSDESGNTASSESLFDVQVEVFDVVRPVISLATLPEGLTFSSDENSTADLPLPMNSTFVSPAASCAVDDRGTAVITLNGSSSLDAVQYVNTSQVGDYYELTYTCTDGLGGEAILTLGVDIGSPAVSAYPQSTDFNVRMAHIPASCSGSFINACDKTDLDSAIAMLSSTSPTDQGSGFFPTVDFKLKPDDDIDDHFDVDEPYLVQASEDIGVLAAATIWVPPGYEGWYLFGTNTDDGVILYVDEYVNDQAAQPDLDNRDSALIHDDNTHSVEDRFGQKYLEAGKAYYVYLINFQDSKEAAVELFAARIPNQISDINNVTFSAYAGQFQLLSKNLFSDSTPPVITLTPDVSSITHYIGDTFSEPEPDCQDNVRYIHTAGEVKSNKVGKYELIYTCADWFGNEAEPRRVTVTVEPSRSKRDSNSPCYSNDINEPHACVNLAYRKPVFGQSKRLNANQSSGWLQYAVDGFRGNQVSAPAIALVDLDTTVSRYRVGVDLGKPYTDVVEVEIFPPIGSSESSVPVEICTGIDQETPLSCSLTQSFNSDASLIYELDSQNSSVQYIEVRSSQSFAIDELLVLGADPFKSYREPVFVPGSTADNIKTFKELVSAVEQYWGADIFLNEVITKLDGQHNIKITGLDSLPAFSPAQMADEVNIAFNFELDGEDDISAYLSTVKVDSSHELMLAFEIPTDKRAWSVFFGSTASNMGSSSNQFLAASKLLVPLSTAAQSNDNPSPIDIEFRDFNQAMKGFLNQGEFQSDYPDDTELSLEPGINLLTKVNVSDLPQTFQDYVGNERSKVIVIQGGLGLSDFDWFNNSINWVVPESFSLLANVPIDANVNLGGLGAHSDEVVAQLRITNSNLVIGVFSDIEFHYGANPTIKPEFRTAGIATFGDDSNLRFQSALKEPWSSPFGICGAASSNCNADINDINLEYEYYFSGLRNFQASAGLEIKSTSAGAASHRLNANYVSSVFGSNNSDWRLRLSLINDPSDNGDVDTIIKGITGGTFNMPEWLNNISELRATVKHQQSQVSSRTHYEFRASVKVCYYIEANKIRTADWVTTGSVAACPSDVAGNTVYQVNGALTLGYDSLANEYSLEVDFLAEDDGTGGQPITLDASDFDFGSGSGAGSALPEGSTLDNSSLKAGLSISNCSFETGSVGCNASAFISGQMSHTDPITGQQDSIGFEFDVSGGSGANSGGVTFFYNHQDLSCQKLQVIQEHHGIAATNSCDTKLPEDSSGGGEHHSEHGLSVSNAEFSVRWNTPAGGATQAYAIAEGQGKYVFTNGDEELFDAIVALSRHHFAVGFDVTVDGNFGALLGMSHELGGDAPDNEIEGDDQSEIAVYIGSNFSGDPAVSVPPAPAEFQSKVAAFVNRTGLAPRASSIIIQGGFHFLADGRLPHKMVDHLHFLGIHDDLQLSTYLDITADQIDFGLQVETFNCEYEPSNTACATFDDTVNNDYPNWFKSADVALDFVLNRKDDKVGIYLGGDLVIHENENEKTGAGPQDLKLHSQVGVEIDLDNFQPNIEVCALLANANSSGGDDDGDGVNDFDLGKPSVGTEIKASSCSLAYDANDDDSPFSLHGIDSMQFSNLKFGIKITPVHIDLEASGAIHIELGNNSEKLEDGIDHPDGNTRTVSLDRLAFSINSQTGVPLGGDIHVRTNYDLSSQQIIELFNHHNEGTDDDVTLKDEDPSTNENNHVFRDITMVGLTSAGDLPTIANSQNGWTDFEIAFGNLGNRFTFSTGFRMETSNGSSANDADSPDLPLGLIDLHLSLSQIHFYGAICMRPLLGIAFENPSRNDPVCGNSFKEELRVDVDPTHLEISGTVEVPKPSLSGLYHRLIGDDHKPECTTTQDNVFEAHNQSSQGCYSDLQQPDGNFWSLRASISVQTDDVRAEGILDSIKCGSGTCELTAEHKALFGLRKRSIPFTRISLDVPYIHIKSAIDNSDSVAFSDVNKTYNQRIVSSTNALNGIDQMALFTEKDAERKEYLSFGDLDGDGDTDVLAIGRTQDESGNTVFPLMYKLGTSVEDWRPLSVDLFEVVDDNGSFEFSPNVTNGDELSFDETSTFDKLHAFQLHNVSPAQGDELVVLLSSPNNFADQSIDIQGRVWVLICSELLSSNASCTVSDSHAPDVSDIVAASLNRSSYPKLIAMDLNDNGYKSIMTFAGVKASGSPANAVFTSLYYDVNLGALARNYHDLPFPETDDLSYVGTLPGVLSPEDRGQKLLSFNNSDGVSTQWLLSECSSYSYNGNMCDTWVSTLIRKSSQEPALFYFGDFDGDGWDDVVSLDVTDADVTSTRVSPPKLLLSSSAQSFWKESDGVNDRLSSVIKDVYSCSDATDGSETFICEVAPTFEPQDWLRIFSSGRGRENEALR